MVCHAKGPTLHELFQIPSQKHMPQIQNIYAQGISRYIPGAGGAGQRPAPSTLWWNQHPPSAPLGQGSCPGGRGHNTLANLLQGPGPGPPCQPLSPPCSLHWSFLLGAVPQPEKQTTHSSAMQLPCAQRVLQQQHQVAGLLPSSNCCSITTILAFPAEVPLVL